MSDPERWAKTDDQVARLHEARNGGGRCSWCGRALGDDEAVYFQLVAVGTKQLRPQRPVLPRAYVYAPVGAECATSDLLEFAEGRDPERCAFCGRGVYHPRPRATRQLPSGARRCAQGVALARRRSQPPVAVPETEHSGARLERYREDRGLSRADLAAGVALLGTRTNIDDIRLWERGTSPRVETFGALARVLGVSMEALLYGPEQAAKVAEELGALVSEEAAPDA